MKNMLLFLVLITGYILSNPVYAVTVTETFQVQMVVTKFCSVKVSPASLINLGTVRHIDTGTVSASGTFIVNCTSGTPYTIGLLPSNGDVNGKGVLTSTTNPSGNTGKISYQLWSTAAGKDIWGNTPDPNNISNKGNGVSGTGTGADQSLNVFATSSGPFPVRDDSYADTVKINVNF